MDRVIEPGELRDAARRAFADPRLAADPQAAWAMIAELGWLMLGVPEDRGGLGLGREAQGVVHSELGRVLAPGPGIAQVLTIAALAGADQPELLERAMSGEIMTASLGGGEDRGVLTAVPDADTASFVLVRTPQRVNLVPLSGADIRPVQTWDETRRLFEVRPGASGVALAGDEAAAALHEVLEAQLLYALAGDSLGGAEAVLAMTIDYLVTRRQFDRPLAMFQALKHRAADLKTRLAAAQALFRARAEGEPSLTELGALKALATTVYRDVAEEAIQLHGGIGLTMEHPCHRFLKRAFLNAALGGDADSWEERAGRDLLARL